MRDIQDFSYQEIAENLDIPLGTIKSRINRARTKLAKIVLNEGK
jgi:RNA polymerase sigma-70 factor (ECF subfamily)